MTWNKVERKKYEAKEIASAKRAHEDARTYKKHKGAHAPFGDSERIAIPTVFSVLIQLSS